MQLPEFLLLTGIELRITENSGPGDTLTELRKHLLATVRGV